MSIFVKIERFGSRPRLIHLTGLESLLGEDEEGLISNSRVIKPCVSILSRGGKYWLVPTRPGVALTGKPMPPGARLELEPLTELSFLDFKFTFFPITGQSEVLAKSDQTFNILLDQAPALTGTPALSISLLSASREWPLIQGISLTVGSASHSTVCLDLPGVKANHCCFKNTAQGVLVQARQGEIRFSDGKTIGACVLNSSGAIALWPLGIELKVSWPDGRPADRIVTAKE